MTTELTNSLTSSWRFLPSADNELLVEFTFVGVHHRTHGAQMMRYVDMVLGDQQVAAIVVDLRSYRYEFGNDIGALFIAVAFDRPRRQSRAVCVVAGGQTKASLKSLLAEGSMDRRLGITFVTTSAEVAEWIARKGQGRQTSA